LAKKWKADSGALLLAFAERIEVAQDFTAATVEEGLRSLAEEKDIPAGRIIHPARLAVSGLSMGPGLFELMELLGRDTCVRRIRMAVSRLS